MVQVRSIEGSDPYYVDLAMIGKGAFGEVHRMRRVSDGKVKHTSTVLSSVQPSILCSDRPERF